MSAAMATIRSAWLKQPGGDVLPAGDKGRFAVTKTADDSYVFRAAPLRNIALTAPYFHSGKVWDLKQAVAIMGTSQLGAELNDEEVTQIVAFLESLDRQDAGGDLCRCCRPKRPTRRAQRVK